MFKKILEFIKSKKGKKILIYVAIAIVVITGAVVAAIISDSGRVVLTNSDPDAGSISGGGLILNGKTTTIYATPNEGYAFESWTNPDGTVAGYEAEHSFVVPKSTIRLTANWKLVELPLTLHLNSADNTTVYPATFNIKTETFFLDDPTREGYTFLGWYKDAELKEKAEDFILTGSTAPVELYARWALSYNVTYVLVEDGASNNPDNPITYTKDHDVDLKHPVYYELKDGVLTGGTYRFLGWHKDSPTGEIVTKLNKTWESDVTLYASWDMSKAVYYDVYEKDGATYVEFGRYPQHVLEDARTIAELKKEISENRWDGTGVYMYKNTLFVKLTAKPYQNDEKTYFSKFSDDSDVEAEKEYFFIVEPIVWRVLSGNVNDPNSELLLLAENVLTSCQFRSDLTTRDIMGKTVYENNWEFSDVRALLNGEFYDEAFMGGERDFVLTATTDYSINTANPDFDYSNGTECEDKVFVLSYKDMINGDYGWSTKASEEDTRRVAKATDYAKAIGVYASINKGEEYDAAFWWLCSAGAHENSASMTSALGSLANHNVKSEMIGVRPAIKVKLN